MTVKTKTDFTPRELAWEIVLSAIARASQEIPDRVEWALLDDNRPLSAGEECQVYNQIKKIHDRFIPKVQEVMNIEPLAEWDDVEVDINGGDDD